MKKRREPALTDPLSPYAPRRPEAVLRSDMPEGYEPPEPRAPSAYERYVVVLQWTLRVLAILLLLSSLVTGAFSALTLVGGPDGGSADERKVMNAPAPTDSAERMIAAANLRFAFVTFVQACVALAVAEGLGLALAARRAIRSPST